MVLLLGVVAPETDLSVVHVVLVETPHGDILHGRVFINKFIEFNSVIVGIISGSGTPVGGAESLRIIGGSCCLERRHASVPTPALL